MYCEGMKLAIFTVGEGEANVPCVDLPAYVNEPRVIRYHWPYKGHDL
jgi:hypothetical protein